jgi:hypothetical protein
MLSMLEALPGEVIEQIFLHSLNLNLPRASPFLSRVLSRESMYRSLILLAFWDDPPDFPGSEAVNRMMVGPLEYVPISEDDRSRLQKQILKCKWLTAERVREQVPTMQILTLHRLWVNTGIKVNEDQQEDFEKLLAREKDSPNFFHGQGPETDKIATLLLAKHGDMIKKMCPNITKGGPHPYELRIKPMVYTEVRCRNLRFAVEMPALTLYEFPDHLLRGRSDGFRPEDVALLEVLRMSSFNWCIGENRATLTKLNRKALNEGIQNAIRTQNLNAMVSLLKIDEFVFRFGDGNKRKGFYTIPQEHFFAVIRTGRDKPLLNAAFFEALLRASAESVPTRSSEMTEWIVDNMNLARNQPSAYNEINYKLARWLSDFQLRLPEQIECLQEHLVGQLFFSGQLDASDVEGGRYIAEVLHPKREVHGNWLKESSFPVKDYWPKNSGPLLPK